MLAGTDSFVLEPFRGFGEMVVSHGAPSFGMRGF